MKTKKCALAWLRQEDWPRWKALDPGMTTYPHWLSKVTKATADAERQGIAVVKIAVDIDDFVSWCTASGRPIDSGSRAMFAGMLLMRRSMAH